MTWGFASATKLRLSALPRLVVHEGLLDTLSEGLSQPLTLVYVPLVAEAMLVAPWAHQ